MCNGTSAGGGGASYSWTIADNSIASFNTSADQYNAGTYLRGNSAGVTSATGYASENGCQSFGFGSPGPTTCDAKIVPAEFTPKCDRTLSSSPFEAILSPSLTECAFRAEGSTCTAKSASGAIDMYLPPITSEINDLGAACHAQYFAGNGPGSIDLGFTLKIRGGAVTLPRSSTVSANCPRQ